LKNPKVREFRAREITIAGEARLAIDIDGEMAGYTPARLRILPAAVRFAVSQGAGIVGEIDSEI
jgi:diacylglycerol kinase family enzyme